MSPYEYNHDVSRVMSFHLVCHLSMLVDWGRRTTASDRRRDRHTDRQCLDLHMDLYKCIHVLSLQLDRNKLFVINLHKCKRKLAISFFNTRSFEMHGIYRIK